MITGTHVLLYSTDVDADRNFFRDALSFPSVDAGRGWLIFALPPAELALHPGPPITDRDAGESVRSELYLMCDDLASEIKKLQAKNIECSPVDEARWGSKTTVRLPSGGKIGFYQPKHPVAIGLK